MTQKTYTLADFRDAWAWQTNRTKNAIRLYLNGYGNGPPSGSLLYLKVTGTDAYLAFGNDAGDANTDAIQVSVDGGAWVTPATTGVIQYLGREYTLFSGLADTTHLVMVRTQASYGSYVYVVDNSSPVLRVVGAAPAIVAPRPWAQPGLANCITATALRPQTGQLAGYKPDPPAIAVYGSETTTNPGGNPASIAVTGNFSRMVILTHAPHVTISIDRAEPIRMDVTNNVAILDGLSGLKDYWVCASNPGSFLAVGGDYTGALIPPAGYARLHQWGDSITNNGASNYDIDPATHTYRGYRDGADTETYMVAAKLRRVGGTLGIDGQKIADIRARIDDNLTTVTVTSADAVINATGFNDGNTWTAQQQADYKYVVDAQLAKGYGTVICRGIFKVDGSNSFPVMNAGIKALAESYGTTRVRYLDTSTWTNIDSPDSTHPTDAGYLTMRNFELPVLATWGLTTHIPDATTLTLTIAPASQSLDDGAFLITVATADGPLSSPLTAHLSVAGGAGAFSASDVTLAAGSTPSATSSFSASAAGTFAISVAAQGFTSPAAVLIVATPSVPRIGAISVPDGRLVKMPALAGGDVTFTASFDPSDRADFAIDFSALLQQGEKIDTIVSVAPSAQAGALGLSVDVGTRRPAIDRDKGVVGFWLKGDPAFAANSSFSGAGIAAGIPVRIRTDATPYREFERTPKVTVRQL